MNIPSIINEYLLNKYGKINDNIRRSIHNRLINYIDKESTLYDEKIAIICNDCINNKNEILIIIEDQFYHNKWNCYKEIEEKRKKSKVERLPNTNIICKKCKEKKIHVQNIQTRSADEGFTSIYICLECRYTWKKY